MFVTDFNVTHMFTGAIEMFMTHRAVSYKSSFYKRYNFM